jgi:O-antigen/teichoic acid export membrane protein
VRSLGFTISPALGEQQSANQTKRAARLYEESFKHVSLLYIPGAVGLVLIAEPLIRHVVGVEYLGAVPVLQILSIFILVNAVNLITTDSLDYLGRARIRAIAKGLTAIANFFLNLLLLPLLGVAGAAAATVITFTAYTATNVLVIHRELDLQLVKMARDAAVVSGISLAMGLVVFLTLPHISGLLTLAGVVAAGFLVWAALSIAIGLIDVHEAIAFLAERN